LRVTGEKSTGIEALAEVVIETETVAAADSETELGDTVQVDSAGAPLQANVTIWLNPPAGETVRENIAVWPAETVVEDEEPGLSEKSSPSPLRATVCGLRGALSLIVSVPALAPPAAGSKKTPTLQLAPTARLLPQELSTAKSPGLAVTPLMLSGTTPVFVRVTP
jgi:hypothetical protein